MTKLTQAALIAVVLAFGCVSAWAGPEEDYNEGAALIRAKNYRAAVYYVRKAALAGHSNGQYLLGLLHMEGEGVLENYVLGHMWLNIAAANGHPKAPKVRDMGAQHMTSAQIAEAQRRAHVCLNSNYTNCD